MYAELQEFVGKVCTIFTQPINRNYNEKQMIDYFVGVVEHVTAVGVITRHPATGCKNFYNMEYIIGICEEEVVSQEEAKHRMKGTQLTETKPASNFNDYKALAGLSQQSKQLTQKPAQ